MMILLWLLIFTMPDGGLYTFDLQTKTIEQIATCETACLHLEWSGNQVAFLDGDQLSIITLNDGERVNIPIDRGVYDYNVMPDWNADFSQVVYAARFDMRSLMVIVDVATGDSTIFEDFTAEDPHWLPDGRIGFYNGGGVQVFDPATEALIDLTADGDIHDLPSWSPDGEQIVLRARVGETDYIWAVMDADGTNGRVLTSAIVEQSIWDETGERIATLLWRDLGGEQIDLVMIADDALIVLAENAVSGYVPAWYQDEIAYIGIGEDDSINLYLIDVNDPLKPVLLVEGAADDLNPAASPIFAAES